MNHSKLYLKRKYWQSVVLNNFLAFRGLFVKRNIGSPVNSHALRILIFNWRDTKHVWAGGAEIYIHEIAKRWVQSGHSVTLFCGSDNLSSRNDIIDGVTIVRRGGHYTVYLWGMLYYLLRFRNRYDVVIDSENGVPFFTPLFVKKPIILLIHHIHQEVFLAHLALPLSLVAIFLETKLMPILYRNKTVVTVSASSQIAISRLGFTKGSQIEIVNPGISHQQFRKTKKTTYPSLLYVGRLKPYKNIDIAIKAFAKVAARMKEAQFTIIGDGESKKSLQRLVKKFELEKQVTFLGKVSDEKKFEQLAKHWVLVQPSMIEGFGITVLEANASGTPVIASNVKGLQDSVVDGKTGLLCKPKDTDAFADALEKMFTDHALRNQLAREAFTYIKRFSWDTSAAQFLQVVLTQLLEKPQFIGSKLLYREAKQV
jgi:glycosyltransferase involved in cell wall biosynthesis